LEGFPIPSTGRRDDNKRDIKYTCEMDKKTHGRNFWAKSSIVHDRRRDRQTDSGGLTGGAVKRGPFVPCHGQRRRPGRDLKIDFR